MVTGVSASSKFRLDFFVVLVTANKGLDVCHYAICKIINDITPYSLISQI